MHLQVSRAIRRPLSDRSSTPDLSMADNNEQFMIHSCLMSGLKSGRPADLACSLLARNGRYATDDGVEFRSFVLGLNMK